MTPRHPLEGAAQLKAPVLGLYGGADTGIPVSTVDQMKAALTQAGSQGNRAAAQSRFVVYPDAPHAFHADYRASYRPAPAADGFGQAVAWLRNPQQS
jgi:carboxymethylenebutenolidase